jgi:hypothetical protein
MRRWCTIRSCTLTCLALLGFLSRKRAGEDNYRRQKIGGAVLPPPLPVTTSATPPPHREAEPAFRLLLGGLRRSHPPAQFGNPSKLFRRRRSSPLNPHNRDSRKPLHPASPGALRTEPSVSSLNHFRHAASARLHPLHPVRKLPHVITHELKHRGAFPALRPRARGCAVYLRDDREHADPAVAMPPRKPLERHRFPESSVVRVHRPPPKITSIRSWRRNSCTCSRSRCEPLSNRNPDTAARRPD